MRLLSHGLYVIFFNSFSFLPMLVDEGRLDGYFLRPLPVFTQVLLSTFSVNGLGDVVVGASSFIVALTLVHVHWTIAKIAFMAIAIVSGALVEAALQTALGCLLLRSPGSRVLGAWIDELLSSFGNYPLSIFPPAVRAVFTFGLPLAFIAYLPARLILGIAASHGAEAWLTRLSPLVGIGMFLAARQLFAWSLKHYVHAGG
jgi:ABC-2 type transport system permease protein